MAGDQTDRGQIMKTLTRTQLWIPAIRARKVKDRVDRAKLLIAAVRDRAIETARPEPSMKRRPARQSRLAKTLSAKS